MVRRVKIKRRRGYTRLSEKNQITIPIDVVREAGLKPGDELKVELARPGQITLARAVDVDARRRAIEETAGSMPGIWKPGDLERLRKEWR